MTEVLWFLAGLIVQPCLKTKPAQRLKEKVQFQYGAWKARQRLERKRPTKKMLADGSICEI